MAEAYDLMRCKTHDDVVGCMAEAYDLMGCGTELLALITRISPHEVYVTTVAKTIPAGLHCEDFRRSWSLS